MFEYFGWVRFSPTFRNAERFDDLPFLDGFREGLGEHIKFLSDTNRSCDLKANQIGEHILFSGGKNHGSSTIAHFDEFFEFVAIHAPGSFGEVTFVDWEHDSSLRWVLCKGFVTKSEHPDFSPPIPKIEDICDD